MWGVRVLALSCPEKSLWHCWAGGHVHGSQTHPQGERMGSGSAPQPCGCGWGQGREAPLRARAAWCDMMRVVVNWVNYIHVARNTVNYVNNSIWGNYIFINWS